MRRPAVARVVLALLLGSWVLGAGLGRDVTAAADATAAIGAAQGRAVASGVYAIYAPQNLLPFTPIAEVSSPDVLTSIASGPSTFARASVADPGDLLANPNALLSLAIPQTSGVVPPYPYRVSANSSVGNRTAEVTPAPGLNARAAADDSGSTASASMPGASAPAVATFGSVDSTSQTRVRGAIATVAARTVLNDVAVMGVLTIDGIVSELTATSDGVATKVVGGTTVTGARLFGQRVTIDKAGVHQGSPSSPPKVPLAALLGTDSINQFLDKIGLHVAIVGGVDHDEIAKGQVATTALKVDFELSDRTYPQLEQALKLIPQLPSVPGLPLGLGDAIGAARARHLVSVELGRAGVSLTARLARAAKLPSLSFVGPPAQSLPSLSQSPSFLGDLAAPVDVSPGAPISTAPRTPIGSLTGGIAVLAILVLLAQPFAGTRLARLGATLVTPGHATRCPREEL